MKILLKFVVLLAVTVLTSAQYTNNPNKGDYGCVNDYCWQACSTCLIPENGWCWQRYQSNDKKSNACETKRECYSTPNRVCSTPRITSQNFTIDG